VRLGVIITTLTACASSRPPPVAPVAAPPPPPRVLKLVVLPAESYAFPNVAKATTDSLLQARADAQASKVSLEVVQLSIECVDPTNACYAAVGHSLAVNGLLFAQIGVVKRKQLHVTVSWFDVDAQTFKATAEKTFPSEQAATAGIADLVAEATR